VSVQGESRRAVNTIDRGVTKDRGSGGRGRRPQATHAIAQIDERFDEPAADSRIVEKGDQYLRDPFAKGIYLTVAGAEEQIGRYLALIID
jgi:hypothetical protein